MTEMIVKPSETQVYRNYIAKASMNIERNILAGSYSLLLGPTYSGKTELIDTVSAKYSDSFNFFWIKLDFAELSFVNSQQSFFQKVATHIWQAASPELGKANYDLALVNNKDRFIRFCTNLNKLLDKNIVLAIDHLEKLLDDFINILLNTLRTLKDEQIASPRFICILSASLNLTEITIGHVSPLRGQLAIISLSELSRQQTAALVEEYLQLYEMEMTKGAIDHLVDCTQGSSILTWRIFSQLAAEKDKAPRVKKKQVRRAVERFIQNAASDFAPLQEACWLIEHDQNTLLANMLLIIENEEYALNKLARSLSRYGDSMTFTGMIHKIEKNGQSYYRIRNRIYQQYLQRYFYPRYVANIFRRNNDWHHALNALEKDSSDISYYMNTATEAIRHASKMSEATSFFAKALQKGFGVHRVAIWLNDSTQGQLRCSYVSFEAEEIYEGKINHYQSIESSAFQNQQPERKTDKNVTTYAVPMLYSSNTGFQRLGIITLYFDLTDNTLQVISDRNQNSYLLQYIQACANAIGSWYERDQQNQAQRSIAATFMGLSQKVSDLITDGKMEEIYNLILETIKPVVPFDKASFQIPDSDNTYLEIVACVGFANPEEIKKHKFPISKPDTYPNVQVFSSREPKSYPDVSQVYEHFGLNKFQLKNIRGWMGIPIIDADRKVIGVITLDSYSIDFYTERHQEYAMLFANEAAKAIRTLNNYAQDRRRLELLILNSKQIYGNIVANDGILQLLPKTAREVFGASLAILYPYTKDDIQLDYKNAVFDIDEQYKSVIQQDLVSIVEDNYKLTAQLRQEDLLIVEDVDAAFLGNSERDYLKSKGFKAFIGIHLKAEDEGFGILFINFTQARGFSSSERDTIKEFAELATVFMIISNLYKYYNQQTEDEKLALSIVEEFQKNLRDIISKNLNLDENAIINELIAFVSGHFEKEVAVAYYEYDNLIEVLHFKENSRFFSGDSKWEPQPVENRRLNAPYLVPKIAKRAYTSKKVEYQYHENLSELVSYLKLLDVDMEEEVDISLVSRSGELIGVLSIESPRKGILNKSYVKRVLESIAETAATFISLIRAKQKATSMMARASIGFMDAFFHEHLPKLTAMDATMRTMLIGLDEYKGIQNFLRDPVEDMLKKIEDLDQLFREELRQLADSENMDNFPKAKQSSIISIINRVLVKNKLRIIKHEIVNDVDQFLHLETSTSGFDNEQINVDIQGFQDPWHKQIRYKGRLQHVLNIIVNNARSHLMNQTQDGVISFHLKRHEQNPQIAVLTVRDNGGGYAPELLELLGNRPLKSSNNGRGIGLFIANSIIQDRYEGRIVFGNVIGDDNSSVLGAEAQIMLPIAKLFLQEK